MSSAEVRNFDFRENPYNKDMWDKSYQIHRQEQRTKNLRYDKKSNVCHTLVFEIFRRCIHFFVCIFAMAMLGMIWIVAAKDEHGTFNLAWESKLNSIGTYMMKHRGYYGI